MPALLVGLLAHVLWADLAPSSWGVPNLTAAALVVAVSRAHRRWLACSAIAGLVPAVWAIRGAPLVWASYVALGGAVRALTRRVDVTDLRIQCALTGLASAAMLGGAVWMEGRWSFPLAGLAVAHVMLTALSVPLVRLAAGRRRSERAVYAAREDTAEREAASVSERRKGKPRVSPPRGRC
jgi:hypothetical protein